MILTKDKPRILIDSFANPTKPAPLCTLSAETELPSFITRTDIGYAVTNGTPETPATLIELRRVSLKSGQPIIIATLQGEPMDVAWSPDGSSVAVLLSAYATDGANGNQVWLKAGSAAPRALTPLIEYGGRDGSLSDQTIVRFSHDGKYLLMVDTYIAGPAPQSANQAVIQVYSVPDGKLIWVPPSALGSSQANKIDPAITMAVWSQTSDRLYYRDLTGVHTWDPAATVATLAAKLVWYSPTMSPDGSRLAYVANMTTQPRIEIRNLLDGSIRVLAGLKGEPLLLSDQEMIEAHYVRNTQFGPPFTPTSYYILNLLTNQETALPGILWPVDNWPR